MRKRQNEKCEIGDFAGKTVKRQDNTLWETLIFFSLRWPARLLAFFLSFMGTSDNISCKNVYRNEWIVNCTSRNLITHPFTINQWTCQKTNCKMKILVVYCYSNWKKQLADKITQYLTHQDPQRLILDTSDQKQKNPWHKPQNKI